MNILVMKMKLHKGLNVKKNSIKTSYFKGFKGSKDSNVTYKLQIIKIRLNVLRKHWDSLTYEAIEGRMDGKYVVDFVNKITR